MLKLLSIQAQEGGEPPNDPFFIFHFPFSLGADRQKKPEPAGAPDAFYALSRFASSFSTSNTYLKKLAMDLKKDL